VRARTLGCRPPSHATLRAPGCGAGPNRAAGARRGRRQATILAPWTPQAQRGARAHPLPPDPGPATAPLLCGLGAERNCGRRGAPLQEDVEVREADSRAEKEGRDARRKKERQQLLHLLDDAQVSWYHFKARAWRHAPRPCRCARARAAGATLT